MRILKGIVGNLERFDTSKNGNPRYTFSIEGVNVFTGVDCALAYGIQNFEGKELSFNVAVVRGKLTVKDWELLKWEPLLLVTSLNLA